MSPVALLLIGMAVVLAGVLWLRLHAFLALILAALAISVLTPRSALEEFAAERVSEGQLTEKQAGKFATQNAASRVAAEFGDGCRKVGIIIAMAAIIGKCLLASGAAQRIVAALLPVVRGGAGASSHSWRPGSCSAIPVFFDTVFYLLMPIGQGAAHEDGNRITCSTC